MKEPAICENHLYAKAYARGRKSVQKHIIVYVLKDKQAHRVAKKQHDGKRVNRLGLTVRKNIGGAVERNRVKRIIRAGYRQCVSHCTLTPGHLIVIVARPRALGASSALLACEIAAAARETGLVK